MLEFLLALEEFSESAGALPYPTIQDKLRFYYEHQNTSARRAKAALHKLELIDDYPNPKNRSSTLVELTPDGRRHLAEIRRLLKAKDPVAWATESTK